jgi:hypothetical protein
MGARDARVKLLVLPKIILKPQGLSCGYLGFLCAQGRARMCPRTNIEKLDIIINTYFDLHRCNWEPLEVSCWSPPAGLCSVPCKQ